MCPATAPRHTNGMHTKLVTREDRDTSEATSVIDLILSAIIPDSDEGWPKEVKDLHDALAELDCPLDEAVDNLYADLTLSYEDATMLIDVLSGFFEGGKSGAFLAEDMDYFRHGARDDLITYLATARKFPEQAVLLRDLLVTAPASGPAAIAAATCRAGQTLSSWAEHDPQLAVVGPALLSYSATRGVDVQRALESIDRVLNTLTTA